MSAQNAKLTITVEGDRAVQKTREIKNGLDQAGQAGQSAGQKIDAGAQQANKGLAQTKVSATQTTLAVAGLAASAVSAFTSLSNLDKAAARLEKAKVGLARATDLLSTKELSLQKMQEKGLGSSEKAKIVTSQIATARADLAVKTEDLRIQEGALVDTQLQMASSLGTTFLTSGILVTQMLSGMAASAGVTTGAFIKMKLATLASAFSMGTLRAAMTLVAAHPLMLIAFAVVTAATILWTTNLFGVRDALIGVWEWLKNIFPMLQLFESAITAIFPPANAEVQQLSDNMEMAAGSTEILGEQMTNLSENIDTGLLVSLENTSAGFENLGEAADNAGGKLDNFKKKQKSDARLVSKGLQAIEDNLSGIENIVNSPKLKAFVQSVGVNNLGGMFGSQSATGNDLAAALFRGPVIKKNSKTNATSAGIGGSAGSQRTAKRFSGSLTKSSNKTGKRRSGRDRNPAGRKDKLNERLRQELQILRKTDVQQAFENVTGISLNNLKFRRFGNNSILNLSKDERQRRAREDFARNLTKSKGRQKARFGEILSEQGLTGGGIDDPMRFLTVQSMPGGFNEIRGHLEFKKRAGQMASGVSL